MTIATAKAMLRSYDITLRKTEYGEFRVNVRGGSEDTACYESDLQAAVDTGLAMAQHEVAANLTALGMSDSWAVR